ncbi:MAG: hypothetical protein QOH93_2615 [Chloroflexia bacterium]|jgi:hypothetical protein|nr:hypothetical protein [Chloroflexia bacterium]
MLLTIAFLCFAIQVVAWVVLPSSARAASDEEGTELAREAVAA